MVQQVEGCMRRGALNVDFQTYVRFLPFTVASGTPIQFAPYTRLQKMEECTKSWCGKALSEMHRGESPYQLC
jgi:hypothetical protein